MIYDSERNDEVQYRRDLGAMEERRRKGMILLAKGFSQSEVARMVGVSRMSVLRWERLKNVTRNAAWKRRKLGRPPKSKRARLKSEELSPRKRCINVR
jgi:transposase